MGLFEGILPNALSYAESSKTLIFPADDSVRKEIPLYLKFTCVEYSMGALARSGGYQGSGGIVGNVKAYVYVPVPSKLVTQTAMRYKQEDNETFMKTKEQKAFEEWISIKSDSVFANLPAPSLGRYSGVVSEGARRLARAYSSMIDTDFTETILQTGSKRSFTISLYMPCLNQNDSKAAAEVTRAFEALALPTLTGVNATVLNIGAQAHFHPPMWFFGIGPLGSVNTDIDWTSQPQVSVLTNVAVTRTAIDASSFTALDENIKPVAYSVTLNFQEIETAFRAMSPGQGTSFAIRNRSGAVKSAGISSLGILPSTP
jgi:hypothetical protein